MNLQKSPKILIVDDHPAIRTTMFDILASEGFKVDLAENGKEAITKYSENNYDYVLLDMQMPDMKGIEVYRQALNQNKSHAEFIFISAFSIPELEQEARDLGCLAYFDKPIDVGEVINLISPNLFYPSILFIENENLRKNALNIIKNKFTPEIAKNLDDTLNRIRQIHYKFVIIDEDSSGLDHERILETIKMSNADTKVIEINEDQEVQSILSRITAAKK